MVVNALAKTCKWMLYLLAALIILIALLAASVRLALLYSADYTEELASLVSNYVGSPVQIGEVDLVWNRFDANASLQDVEVRSADGSQTLIELPSIELQLNVRDVLLERRLTIRNVQLSDLSLTASYEGSGQLRMFGKTLDVAARDTVAKQSLLAESSLEAEEGPDRRYSVLNWLFNAEQIAILDSDITLINAEQDHQYKVDNVNIRAFNDGDKHQIRITSALPDDVGDNSLASFDFTGKADNFDEWQGQFYINTRGLRLSELSGLWRLPEHQYTGTSDLQLWGEWSGANLQKVRAIATLSDLSLQQSSTALTSAAVLETEEVAVDLDWARLQSGWQLTFNQFSGRLNKGQDIELDGLEMLVTREPKTPTGVESDKDQFSDYFSVTGPAIDLQALAPLYAYIDDLLPAELPFKVRSLQSGLLTDWRASVVRTDKRTTLTELQLNAVDLAIDAYGNTPGINGLTTSLVYVDGSGRLQIDNQSVGVTLPALYEAPLPEFNIDGAIDFLVNTGAAKEADSAEPTTTSETVAWKVVAQELHVSTQDFSTSSSLSVRGMTDGAHLIDSRSYVQNVNLPRLKDYLPVRKLKPRLHNWLQTAIVAGDAVRGRVEIKGNLNDFSPANGKGHFYAEADLIDTTVKFRPDWPAATAMDGNVSFSTTSMRGRVYQGAIRSANFSDAHLLISDFKQPVVEVKTNAIGPVDDMLDFMQTGPLAAKIGKAFGNSTGSGTSRLEVDLKVPLKKELSELLVVDGEIILDSAQITSVAYGVDLDSVTGKLRFNRRGVLVDGLQVRYQGLPLSVEATQESSATANVNSIRVNGPVAVSSVLRSYGIPLVDQLDGISDWTLEINITRPVNSQAARVELIATSDLAGTALKLPVPIKKASDELRQARLYRNFAAQDKDWWLELPGLMKTRLRIGADSKLTSMVIALGDSENTVLPWRGISIHGNADRIDAAGWVKFVTAFSAGKPKSDKTFPVFAKINTPQMIIGDQRFGELIYIAYQDGGNQVHRIESAPLSGEFTVKDRSSGQPMVIRLDRLDKQLFTALAGTQPANQSSGLSAQVTNRLVDPRKVPALDVRVSELIWDNWRLAKLALRTEPDDQGLRITALNARQNDMRVSGQGYWHQYAGADSHLTALDLTASFDDFGLAMREVANATSFAGGSGEAALSLSWPTPAYAPDLQQLEGQLLFNLREGRILSVQPGAGRILGLFALQSLPRRLAFDFRDITDNGLAYNSVSGNLTVADGFARTNAIAMTGPVAEILIHGNTGFVDKTYDQTIDVLPRVSGALPLLGVLSGGPVAGVTALLADGVLKGIGVNLDEIGRRRYSLSGSWNEPVWQAVNAASGQISSR